ncbi:MAG TPA: amino acid racemase [Bacillota bacterium]|nr:amino acid racemase [Bacillota bacterium]
MKRIGILGGLSAESTALFYNTLTRLYIEQNGDTAYPEIVIFSVQFSHFLSLMKNENKEACAHYLASGIQALEKAGADFAVISANTPHLLFDQIAQKVSIPLLHIAETVTEVAKSEGYTKVALLGTMATMNADFYPISLSRYDIACITPNEEQKEIVNGILERELYKGIVNEKSRTLYLDLIQQLKKQGAEAIILGCTEIPMLIHPGNSPLPLLDSAAILAQAALDRALQ